MAGTGKSTIAHTVARDFFEQGRLAASFFFSRGGGDAGNARKFVTTIAVQLATYIPLVQRYIRDAVTECSIIANQSLADQWHRLVIRPLLKLDGSNTYPYVIVLDALDECEVENDIRIILRLLAEARSLEKLRLRILVTSRPEIPISYGFSQIPDAELCDFILHDIEASIVDHDISIFLDHEMRSIGQEWSFEAGWPGEQALGQLVRNASGLFIWAATACRFIQEGGKRFARDRLSTILRSGSSTTEPEKHLDEIYLTVLVNSISPRYNDFEKGICYGLLTYILGSVVILSSQLPTHSLSILLCFQSEEVDDTIKDLSAILDAPKGQSCVLRLHHPSLRDFLLNEKRCTNTNFLVDEVQAHRMLAINCIRLMSTTLKKDICGLKNAGVLVTDVEKSQIEHSLPPEVQYACLYWIQHLQKSGTQLHDNDLVHQFLQQHLLHWLEALGWIQRVSEGIHAIASLESIVAVSWLLVSSKYLANMWLSYVSVRICPNLSMTQSGFSSITDRQSSRHPCKLTVVRLYLHRR
jgi:hypothetical protein